MKRACLNCGRVTLHRYCTHCKPIERLPGRTGRKLREQVLARDGYRCVARTDGQRCTATLDLQVDHKTPLSQGGTNNPVNLQTLCRTHHAAKTKAMN